MRHWPCWPVGSLLLPHQPSGILRLLLSADRLPHFQVNFPASNSGCPDGVWRIGLAHLSVAAARKLSVSLQHGSRSPRRRIADAVASSDGSERTKMEGKSSAMRFGPN